MIRLPEAIYSTPFGSAHLGDSLKLLPLLPSKSIDLVFTSPPFALQRQKEYGNKDQWEYVDWLLSFAPEVFRVLKDAGSFVIDMGGAYKKGKPIRSLYQYRFLLRMCDEFQFQLAEEFYWYNPAKLPSPIEWVNKRKLRAKDSVNSLWWLSKSDNPKADIRRVLNPYSDRMKSLLKNPENWYTPKKRPSGHDIGKGFGEERDGAIPSNLLQIANTESNSPYLRLCKAADVGGHPARFPQRLPEFFVKFLTEPGDLILDIFAGSNTTGAAAESLGRRWLSFELDRGYIATSAFRFLDASDTDSAANIYRTIADGGSALRLAGAPLAPKISADTVSGKKHRASRGKDESLELFMLER